MAAAGVYGEPRRDFEPSELFTAASITLLVLALSALGFSMGQSGSLGYAPEVVPLAATPIRVTPVIDMDAPALKLGGRRVRAKLPKEWQVAAPPKPAPEGRKATVSTKAKDKVEDIPPKNVEVSDAGPPPEDAAVTEATDAAVEPEASDAEVSGTGGGSGSGAGSGGGSPEGVDGGTLVDPLQARAIKLWRGRVSSWFLAGFSPSCAGLGDAERKAKKARAVVTLGGDGTVLSYSLTPSGFAGIDGPAKAALDQKVGQQIPPPPEKYNIKIPNTATPVFVCR